jgi:hypothetical protein
VSNPGRLITLPAKRDWCQIRRVGFHEEPILRNEAKKLVVSPFLECYDAAEGDIPTSVDRERSEGMSASVAMQYASDSGRACVTNDCTRIVLGVPSVHDDWSPGLGGKLNLRGERVSLGVAGRVVVMVVETAFADRDSPSLEQLAQLRNVPSCIEGRGVVRMDAGRRENEARILSRARGGDRRGID